MIGWSSSISASEKRQKWPVAVQLLEAFGYLWLIVDDDRMILISVAVFWRTVCSAPVVY